MWKPSQQEVLEFTAEAWAAVLEETVACSFEGCGITSALEGSEDNHLHDRFAHIGAVAPEDYDEFRNNCLVLVFMLDSEKSFGSDRKC